MRRTKKLRLIALLLTLGCATAVVSAQPAKKSTEQKAKAKSSADVERYIRPTDPSLYVGADTCKTCHEDIYKDYANTAHAQTLQSKRGPAWQGCEACHGPGKAHVDGGGDITKIFTFKNASAEETSARCLDCHELNNEHGNFVRAAHLENGVGCLSCHSPHHAKESQFLMKEKTPELCYGCHQDIKARFDLPFHHRVNEGLVECNDCHNPHGGFQQTQLRTAVSQDAVCVKCHAEKAGPFVYEHPPVKIEGCTSCHTPHGSVNPRLLKTSQVNLLCIQCHSLASGAMATPTFHNQAQKYQACTMCHTAIHGSNTDPDFFK
jgi:DmsE family decaheme c-type cytochrome